MNKKKKNYGTIKLIISIVIICLFIWFLIISPKMTFDSNENKMREAAKRYFELNSSELPTGKRVKTITLTELYSKKYLDSDFYAPYSNNLCNQTDSWVKVRKQDNGSYEYLVYLNCGVLQSNIDHKGPEIKLNGDSKITIEEGNKYTEKGIKSVTDNNDGKLSVKDVDIKGSVDTSKVGTYTVQYIAFDSLKNKTVVKRVVTVVKSIRNVVKKDLGNSKNYVGNPENNYVRFSNMMFRVYGLDSDNNVILVAAEDVANVNFTKIDKWLNEYYYNHLTAKAKKMIVKAKYCNMNVTDSILDTTECSSYTKKINVYVVKKGRRINIEKNLYIDILWPNEKEMIADNWINNNSLVFKLVYKDFSIMFTGDIEEEAEKAILEQYSNNINKLQANILKIAHHGSKTSTTENFLKTVSPKIALIGVGKNNKFGHPNEQVIERLKANKVKIYRTDEDGETNIVVNRNGEIVNIQKFIK